MSSRWMQSMMWAVVATMMSGTVLAGCSQNNQEHVNQTGTQNSGGPAEESSAGEGSGAGTATNNTWGAEEMEVPEVRQGTVSATEEAAMKAIVNLADGTTTYSGTGVIVEGDCITFTEEGEYLIRGSLSSGQLIVNTPDEEKVKLWFDGASVSNSETAPVVVVSAPKKVVFATVEDSVNLVQDLRETAVDNADTEEVQTPTAAIYSKDDLSFTGDGTLYVLSYANKGVLSKDDIEIKNGSFCVGAAGDGIQGKDSVTVSGGTVVVNAGEDGIRSTQTADETKGYVCIMGGTVSVTSSRDAIQAETDVTISGGVINLVSGGGSNDASFITEQDASGDMPGGNRFPGGGNMVPGGGRDGQNGQQMPQGEMDGSFTVPGFGGMDMDTGVTGESCKGIKAGRTLSITGGTIQIDSADDALHSNAEVVISGGEVCAGSGDDGIHGDNAVTIDGGVIEIAKSYEGIEAAAITINNGTIHVTASDDGLNASDGSGSAGGMVADDSLSVNINGGYMVVNADGDGLDSNGNLTMTGGTVIVYGPTNSGNGSLDYAGSACVNGGWLLAVGSSGMAQSVNAGDGMGTFACQTSMISAGTLVCLQDGSGQELLTFAPEKNIQSIVFCCEALDGAGDITLYTGGSCDGTETDGVFADGTYSGGSETGYSEMNGNGGFGGGGFGGGHGRW